jgi:hypothetical protein
MFYYIKSVEELGRYLEDGEIRQSSNLSNTLGNNPNDLVDLINVESKLLAAQSEVETLLANRGFDIQQCRLSDCSFIKQCVAVIAWWNMEIQGDRELPEKKYREIIKRLTELNVILNDNGIAIYPKIQSEDLGVKKRRKSLIGNRGSNVDSLRNYRGLYDR